MPPRLILNYSVNIAKSLSFLEVILIFVVLLELLNHWFILFKHKNTAFVIVNKKRQIQMTGLKVKKEDCKIFCE